MKLKRNAAFFRHLEAIAGNVFEIPSFIGTVFSFRVVLPLYSVRSYWSLRLVFESMIDMQLACI